MARIRTLLGSNRGTALMTSVMVMTMVAGLGLTYIALTTTNLVRAGRDQRTATAFYLAEAGMEHVLGTVNSTLTSQTVDTTSIVSDLVPGSTGTVTIVADGGPNIYGTIVSRATYRGITQSIRVRVRVRNVAVWNNAIFAGIGSSGKGINGNVDVRGSVHILGDGEPYTDLNGNGQWDDAEAYTDVDGDGQCDNNEPFVDTDHNGVWSPAEPFQDNDLDGVYDAPLTAADITTDLSGSANIGNNYAGIPDDLRTRIPALAPQNFGGEMVYTLNAELRVKHGKVDLSGSALAGAPNVTGNTLKETLDGTYVTDGFGGNKGASSVYSDNGTINGYDLGDRVPFPSLFTPYLDKATGVDYATYEAYLDSRSMLVTTITNISPTTPSFICTDGTNTLAWSQTTKTLAVDGIVRFAGDLDLGTKDAPIYYTGRGTLFGKNDVRVHGSFLPVNTFPTSDVLGVIAKRDVLFAAGSGEAQLKAAGAWYAERRMVSAKQNQFAGTYVSNYFDMGTNVPSIYQVPSLVNNLPPGMPGGEHIWVTQILSWRRI